MDPLFSALVYSIGVLDLIDILGYFVAHARGDKLQPPVDREAFKKISGGNDVPVGDPSNIQSNVLNKDTDKHDLGEDQVNELKPKKDTNSIERLVVDTNEDHREQSTTTPTTLNVTTESDDVAPKQQVDLGGDSLSTMVGSEGAKTENQTQVFIETEREASERDAAPNSLDESKLRPISRDDELRHHRIKRSSTSSVSSHGSRKEELEALSTLEAEEQGDDNFTPIIYSGSDYPLDLSDDIDYLETIPEAGSSSNSNESAEFTEQNVRETSPKPNIPADVSLPWGDLKTVAHHSRDSWVKDRSLSIDEVAEEDDKTPKDETIIVQKKINLIGIKPSANKKEIDVNNNEDATQTKAYSDDGQNVSSTSGGHIGNTSAASAYFIQHESLVQPPIERSLTSSPYSLLARSRTPSESNEDQGEILRLNEENLAVRADDDTEADADVIEYYWKPGSSKVEPKSKLDEDPNLNAAAKKLVSWESGDDVCKIDGPTARNKSHSIAYESIKYDRVAARKLSLAETFIIPKHLNISDDRVSESIVALENEAEEYKYLWGIDTNVIPLAENERFPRRRASRSQSISYDTSNLQNLSKCEVTDLSKISKCEDPGQTPSNSSTSLNNDDLELPALSPQRSRIRSQSIAFDSARFQRRRTSLAESFIIPRSIRESGGIDFQTLAQMEAEAEAYRSMWGLDVPDDVESSASTSAIPTVPEQPPPPRKSARSQSISMGVLARRGLRKGNRRSSVADMVLVPRTMTEELSNDDLAMLENEAYAYQQAFGLEIPNIHEPDDDEKTDNVKENTLKIEAGTSNNTTKRDALTPIRELSEARSRSTSPQSPTGVTHKLPHIVDTSFSDEDEELIRITSQSLKSETKLARPTTPADYEQYMKKFPDQLCPDITVETAAPSVSPTLEMYLQEMEKRPSPSRSPVEVQSSPATLEVYLERMRSQTPSTPPQTPERATTPADYAEYMQKFPDQLCPDINVQPAPSTSPTLEMYLQEMERGSSPVKSPPKLQSPPATLEVYLERMRSKSPSPSPRT